MTQRKETVPVSQQISNLELRQQKLAPAIGKLESFSSSITQVTFKKLTDPASLPVEKRIQSVLELGKKRGTVKEKIDTHTLPRIKQLGETISSELKNLYVQHQDEMVQQAHALHEAGLLTAEELAQAEKYSQLAKASIPERQAEKASVVQLPQVDISETTLESFQNSEGKSDIEEEANENDVGPLEKAFREALRENEKNETSDDDQIGSVSETEVSPLGDEMLNSQPTAELSEEPVAETTSDAQDRSESTPLEDVPELVNPTISDSLEPQGTNDDSTTPTIEQNEPHVKPAPIDTPKQEVSEQLPATKRTTNRGEDKQGLKTDEETPPQIVEIDDKLIENASGRNKQILSGVKSRSEQGGASKGDLAKDIYPEDVAAEVAEKVLNNRVGVLIATLNNGFLKDTPIEIKLVTIPPQDENEQPKRLYNSVLRTTPKSDQAQEALVVPNTPTPLVEKTSPPVVPTIPEAPSAEIQVSPQVETDKEVRTLPDGTVIELPKGELADADFINFVDYMIDQRNKAQTSNQIISGLFEERIQNGDMNVYMAREKVLGYIEQFRALLKDTPSQLKNQTVDLGGKTRPTPRYQLLSSLPDIKTVSALQNDGEQVNLETSIEQPLGEIVEPVSEIQISNKTNSEISEDTQSLTPLQDAETSSQAIPVEKVETNPSVETPNEHEIELTEDQKEFVEAGTALFPLPNGEIVTYTTDNAKDVLMSFMRLRNATDDTPLHLSEEMAQEIQNGLDGEKFDIEKRGEADPNDPNSTATYVLIERRTEEDLPLSNSDKGTIQLEFDVEEEDKPVSKREAVILEAYLAVRGDVREKYGLSPLPSDMIRTLIEGDQPLLKIKNQQVNIVKSSLLRKVRYTFENEAALSTAFRQSTPEVQDLYAQLLSIPTNQREAFLKDLRSSADLNYFKEMDSIRLKIQDIAGGQEAIDISEHTLSPDVTTTIDSSQNLTSPQEATVSQEIPRERPVIRSVEDPNIRIAVQEYLSGLPDDIARFMRRNLAHAKFSQNEMEKQLHVTRKELNAARNRGEIVKRFEGRNENKPLIAMADPIILMLRESVQFSAELEATPNYLEGLEQVIIEEINSWKQQRT